MTETVLMILWTALFVLLAIMIMIAAAIIRSAQRIELLVGDLLAYTIEKINLEEAEKKEKPPDEPFPQARADAHKTPLVRRSAERLAMRRNEALR